MGKQKNFRIALGAGVAGLALFAAVAGGAAAKGGNAGGGGTSGGGTGGGTDTKAGAFVGATCTADVVGYAGYNKSGSAVTLGVGATADNTGSTWTITVTDNLDGEVYSGSNNTATSDWSLLQNYTASKGLHVVSVHMVSDADGVGTCDASLSFKN